MEHESTSAAPEGASEPLRTEEEMPLDVDHDQGAVLESAVAKATTAAPRLTLLQWFYKGLRAGVFLNPQLESHAAPTPWQVLGLFALTAVIHIGFARLEVEGAATFYLRGWLIALCVDLPTVFLLWAAVVHDGEREDRPHAVVTWYALSLSAAIPVSVVGEVNFFLSTHASVLSRWAGKVWFAWAVYMLLWTWSAWVAYRLSAYFVHSKRLRSALVGALLVLGLFFDWQFQDRPWREDHSANGEDSRPRLELSQETFEQQQAVLSLNLDALTPARSGRVNVFGLVYAPYEQDVFLRESGLVATVLEQRFEAAGHTLRFVNHAATTSTLPWATPLNLQRGIAAMARQMDVERDVLVIYLTSHGGSDFKLASEHWPLKVDPLTPAQLRKALDDAGVRNRVIMVSACFSGGWVEPLSTDTSLVITAADATHTSYGCGSRSELTFFGRAMFEEQLRKTHSFEDAFAAAVPIIKKREEEGGKEDGFSNPQIKIGPGIRPVLKTLQAELDAPH